MVYISKDVRPRIDEGLETNYELLLAEDSVGVNSYFKYDQGLF